MILDIYVRYHTWGIVTGVMWIPHSPWLVGYNNVQYWCLDKKTTFYNAVQTKAPLLEWTKRLYQMICLMPWTTKQTMQKDIYDLSDAWNGSKRSTHVAWWHVLFITKTNKNWKTVKTICYHVRFYLSYVKLLEGRFELLSKERSIMHCYKRGYHWRCKNRQ